MFLYSHDMFVSHGEKKKKKTGKGIESDPFVDFTDSSDRGR